MKKILIAILIIACAAAAYFLLAYKKVDLDIKQIQEMDVIKYKNVMVYDGNYKETDKDKINEILNALKDRTVIQGEAHYGDCNYEIYMRTEDKKGSKTDLYRYQIWFEYDGGFDTVYITMPDKSDKQYKINSESVKKIKEYITKINIQT